VASALEQGLVANVAIELIPEPLLYLGGFDKGGQLEARVRRLAAMSATNERVLEGVAVEVTLERAAAAASYPQEGLARS
jgi:hypothetical protein